MITVRLETDRLSPDRHTVSIRTSVDDWQESIPLAFAPLGPAAAPAWSVVLDRPGFADGFELKFVFNGSWQGGKKNLVVPPYQFLSDTVIQIG